MTRDLFAEWLSEFDRDTKRQGRRVQLVIDNCSSHHVQTALMAVTLLFRPPNTTSKVEQLDGLVVAVVRPAANLPLRVSLYSAVEVVKAAWSEVTATCVRNCFRKAGFVDKQPEAEPDASDGQSGGDLRKRGIDCVMGSHDLGWDDLVCADKDADTAQPCTDEDIVNEVCGARAMRRNRTRTTTSF
ncbi:hypothetical protein HPB48_013670 [Haemaphysalis longicornis]|uniref:DDE-1 domain-containing protein n=1 Tax=Haemaphysalis longicornis TaxID=44386 RepID=A0A9J6GGJ8_HAELO|nr:hypothetical protein HPB48_013670 [Haemaphysalis longicornis]